MINNRSLLLRGHDSQAVLFRPIYRSCIRLLETQLQPTHSLHDVIEFLSSHQLLHRLDLVQLVIRLLPV